MRILILGAGLQGSACAYDLLQNPDVQVVHLADKTVDHLPPFLRPLVGDRLVPVAVEFHDREALRALMEGCDAVASAAPYYLNLDLAALAVDAGCHFCDLGGNTEIVFAQQRALDALAKANGVSVIPDCGVAPGMVNILAQHGIAQMDAVTQVRIYVGGLPQHPEPPLNYQIVYSLEGVLDYYTTPSWVLRDSQRTTVAALSEREAVTVDGVGALEAFHTAGGLSTMAFRYEGKIPEMEYKTLRYPGHAQLMESIRALGLLSNDAVTVHGQSVVPRDVFVAVVGPLLTKRGPDLVALRVVVRGTRAGAPAERVYELVDRYDATRGITAMMRCTGYSLSITTQLQARGAIAAGAHTPDECMPADVYIAELATRGVIIHQH